MKICIDCGHCLSGADTGAVGNGFKEQDKDREVGRALKKYLEQKGHSVVMTNVDGGCTSVNQSLQKRVNVANASKADFFISLHLDAASPTASGTCPFVYSLGGQAEVYAKRILNKMVGLGFANRGVRVANHYVTRCTNMPAVLLELCFITSPKDMGMFNADKMGKAIAEAIINENIQEATPVAQSQQTGMSLDNYNATAKDDIEVFNTDGSHLGWIDADDQIKIMQFDNDTLQMLVEYPVSNGTKKGYIKHEIDKINFRYDGMYKNGSTIEHVFSDSGLKNRIGCLDEYEKATVIKRLDGRLYVLYDTAKGAKTKAGFVLYDGGFSEF